MQHDVVQHIDNTVHRPLTGQDQLRLHPGRRIADAHPIDAASQIDRAIALGADRYLRGSHACINGHLFATDGGQRQIGIGSQLTGNAAGAHAVTTVGGNGEIEDCLLQIEVFAHLGTHRRFTIQNQKAACLLGQPQFLFRTAHAEAGLTADVTLLDLQTTRQAGAHRSHGHLVANAHIGGAADDGQRLLLADIDREQLQLVGIRMRLHL